MPIYINKKTMPEDIFNDLSNVFGQSIIDTRKTIKYIRNEPIDHDNSMIIRYRSGRFYVYFTSGPLDSFVYPSIEAITRSININNM